MKATIMNTDLILTLVHHLAAFGLVSCAAMQWILLRDPPGALTIRRLGRIDIIYGVLVAVILAAGFWRAFHGDKGWVFYRANPAFHAKLTVFLLVGLLSALPTIRFIQWRRRLAADPAFTVPEGQWRTVRRLLVAEFHLLLIIPLLAALAARGIGMR